MTKHMLLIVIDCLRADHVSAYGYGRPTTPTLDELAATGICWTNAHSVSSWTKPSVSSLLTGYYPRQHGAFRGLKRSKSRGQATSDVLSDRAITLAERLSPAGYRCGAFINNVQLDHHSGLSRGFSNYVADAGKADRLIESVSGWIRENPRDPWFAYLHFLEAHWPYKPRRRHVEMFGGNRDRNPFAELSARDFGLMRKAIHRGQATFSAADNEHLMVLYDAAIRRLDGKLRTILKSLRQLDVHNETAIFVTADHGEEFLDHGSIGHGHTLYEELTHVPLIASVPDRGGGVRIDEPVSHVDVVPTLLALAGIESPARDLTDVHGERSPVVSELVIRNKVMRTLVGDRWKLHQKSVVNSPDSEATDSGCAVNSTASTSETLSLFDLSSDPKETTNLIDTDDGRVHAARLSGCLDEWSSRYQPLYDEQHHEVEVDERVVQRLRDLGYVE